MSSKKQVDFLIVGQGLAGSCVALELLKRNKSVFVIDHVEANRATSVAAGLFNPVTGKNMVKTWRADELFSALHSFYREAEILLNEKFFYPMPLYRPFASIEEQNEWMGRSVDSGMKDYLIEVFSSSRFGNEVKDPLGGVLLNGCGYLDTKKFADAVRRRLVNVESYESSVFDERELQLTTNQINYQNIQAQKVIYCNGLGVLKSKFFNSLPIRSLKGEVLTVELKKSLKRIYNRGVYVVPSAEEGIYKIGATYSLTDKSEGITLDGKNELTGRLDALINLEYEILNQEWGMRPTTIDRKPILGTALGNPNVVIFNGLGTKGVSLAPFFSNQLVNWLTEEEEVEPTVNIDRFLRRKSNFY